MSLDRLKRALAAGDVRRAYVVLGDAVPLVEQARAAIEAAVRPRIGLPAFNHGRYRATDPGAATAFTAARTLPMMAARRLVELRDVADAPADVLEKLVEYLREPAPDAVLVAVGGSFPKVEKGGSNWAARIKGALSDDAVLVQIGNDDVKPERFVIDAVEARGKIISLNDAELLVAVVGTDLGRLEQEVEKLALFVGDRLAVDADAIGAASSVLAEAVIWDLTAGLATRDADAALAVLHRLMEAGDDARKLLGMIAWQMRELVRVAELVQAGANDKDITSRVRIRWDVLKKVRPLMADGSFPDAAELLRRIATANRHMNSHRAGAERILEGLVLEMLEGRLRRPPPVPRPR